MPEQGTKPVNKYLPPRPKDQMDRSAEATQGEGDIDVLAPFLAPVAEEPKGFLGWLDRTLEKI